MVMPFQRTTTWAEPSTWPAGTSVTSTPSRSMRLAVGQRPRAVPAKPSP